MKPLWLLSALPLLQVTWATEEAQLPEITQMKTLSGRINIEETLNFTQIERHLHLWISELGNSADKTDRLVAASAMREYSLLKDTLLAALPGNVATSTQKTQHGPPLYPPLDNQLTRNKRNIIGDFLNYVGGVATEDQLKKQLIIDKEIRDKITSTLTRQLSFEHTIAAAYSNLTLEEDALHRKVDDIVTQNKRNRAHASKLRGLLHIAVQDIENMEDCLSAIWQQQASPRQAARLAVKAGLKTTPPLHLLHFTGTDQGIILTFQTSLWRTTAVKIWKNPTHTLVETDEDSYYLHIGHPLHLPIDSHDPRALTGTCPTCAIAVHIDDTTYKIVQEGHMTCNHDNKKNNYTRDDLVTVYNGLTCWNEKMKIEPKTPNLKVYSINLALTDVEIDSIILQRELGNTDIQLDGHFNQQKSHKMTNLKLQQELKTAQQGLSNFISTTKTDMSMSFGNSGHYISWGILAVTTPILLFIVAGIMWRCMLMRRTSREDTV